MAQCAVEHFRPDLPADCLFFSYTHDVLQSPAALDNLLAISRPGARIVLLGMKTLPWLWGWPVNLVNLYRARRYLTTYANLDCPWRQLARRGASVRRYTARCGAAPTSRSAFCRAAARVSPSRSGDRPGSWLAVVKVALALLFLNAAVSFDNLWPTPGITPDTRLAPEFVLLWTLLLLAVGLAGMPGPRLIGGLAFAYTLLVIGRYADVTAPALFGRSINLYWDGRQIPRFLAVSAQGLASWQTLAILLGRRAAAVGDLPRGAPGHSDRRARRGTPCIAFPRDTADHRLGDRAGAGQHRRRQGNLALRLAPGAADLSASGRPPADRLVADASERCAAAIAGLRLRSCRTRRADVKLMFLESYGAVAFDNPALHQRLAASRDALARQIAASGRQVVSAFVRSPTFGGASDLAHLGLLSGIDLSDPVRHDLLLTSQRPTLISLFTSAATRPSACIRR